MIREISCLKCSLFFVEEIMPVEKPRPGEAYTQIRCHMLKNLETDTNPNAFRQFTLLIHKVVIPALVSLY